MSSVDTFCLALKEIRDTLQGLIDDDFIPESGNRDNAIDLIIRGANVKIFCAFEDFIHNRSHEISNYLTQKRINSDNLSSTKIDIAKKIIKIFAASKIDESHFSDKIDGISKSLKSLDNSPFVSNEAIFTWPGSNIQINDLEEILMLFGKNRVEGSKPNPNNWMTRTLQIVDSISYSDSNFTEVFKTIARIRHETAHNINRSVHPQETIAVAKTCINIAFTFDFLLSLLVQRVINADLGVLRFNQLKLYKIEKSGETLRVLNDNGSSRKNFPESQLPNAFSYVTNSRSYNKSLSACLLMENSKIVNWKIEF